MSDAAALVALLRALTVHDYRFTTITPASHARVAQRWRGPGLGLRDLFGWSRPVERGSVPPRLVELAEAAGILVEREEGVASTHRVSALRGRLFLHSAWPTEGADSVFFGPDTYRFARFIAEAMASAPRPRRIVDIGAGAGVGGIVAADLAPGAELVLTDVNATALPLACANAEAAGHAATCVEGSAMDGVEGVFDLAVLNPPYLVDDGERAYRHGGGMLGTDLPLSLSVAAMERLSPGGRLVLYSGSPIVGGEDAFRGALAQVAAQNRCTLDYEELDPDVFGEELERPVYASVDRIALIGAVCVKAGEG